MKKKSSLKNSGLADLFRGGGEREAPRPRVAAKDESAEGGSQAEGSASTGKPPEARSRERRLFQPSRSFPAVIRVVGVGGGGTNAVNRMLEAGLEGVEFIAVNTDAQALQMSEADHKLRIGGDLTRGLGGGSDPGIGRDSALNAYDDLKSLVKGSDMVFITAGEGGGTGTGAAPVIAEIARSVGALTIGVVSKPFAFEGRRRQQQAEEGIRELREKADTVIVVPNDRLLEVVERGTTMVEALRVADDVLRQGVQGICDLVIVPGLINLDLADVRTIMTGAGTAHMGIGVARGEQRAEKAADMAVNSSLLETSIEGARGILLNISGGSDLSLFEANEVAEIVNRAADPEANIIFGAVVDESLGDQLKVTVVAAGIEGKPRPSHKHETGAVAEGEQPGTGRPGETGEDEGAAGGSDEIPELELPAWTTVREPERDPARVTQGAEAEEPAAPDTSSPSGETAPSQTRPSDPELSRGEEEEDLDIPSFLRREED
ncbi:MAG TPA: cell division protein FtsZ [Thermoleophilia bacterium]|nr:cell division protein FtsZ [Thermoleophilia bacterium]